MTSQSTLDNWLRRIEALRKEVEDQYGYRPTIGDGADLYAHLDLTAKHLRRMRLNASRREIPLVRRAA